MPPHSAISNKALHFSSVVSWHHSPKDSAVFAHLRVSCRMEFISKENSSPELPQLISVELLQWCITLNHLLIAPSSHECSLGITPTRFPGRLFLYGLKLLTAWSLQPVEVQARQKELSLQAGWPLFGSHLWCWGHSIPMWPGLEASFFSCRTFPLTAYGSEDTQQISKKFIKVDIKKLDMWSYCPNLITG